MLAQQMTWRSFRYSANDGLSLHARDYGSREAPGTPLVCLPGLTRSSGDFHDIADALANDDDNPRRVVCFDYRGRGQSDYDRNWRNYTPARELDDILTGMTAAGIGHASILGTSRGAMIALFMAAVRPAAMNAVVLNDFGPEIEPKGLARIKGYVTREPHIPRSWDAAAESLKRIHGAHFPQMSEGDWLRYAHQTYREVDGKPALDYDKNLARTLEGLDLDDAPPTMWPQFDALAHIPTLALRGENSDILSADCLAEMVDRHEGLKTFTVPRQGHAPLLWDKVTIGKVAAFLAEHDRVA